MVTKKYKVHDEDVIKKYCEKFTTSQLSKEFKLDPRIIHRSLRNKGLIEEEEPDAAIRLRIKDTSIGRKLAEKLNLKVGVIYPDGLKDSDIGSEVPK